MSDLLKLNNIVQRNGDIKAFPLSSNWDNPELLKEGSV